MNPRLEKFVLWLMPTERAAQDLGRIVGVAIALGIVLLIQSCLPAKAAPAADPYEMWVMPPGQLCISEVNLAYWKVGVASDYYDAAPEIDIVHPDTGCAGFPRRRTIVVATYVDHTVAACAKASGVEYSWLFAYGRWTWVAEKATIWINAAPEAKTRCFSHSTGVAHVASHELGHILGLAHNNDPSVMGAWSYYWPTALDKARVKARYTVPLTR